MTRFEFYGKAIDLPAIAVDEIKSGSENAWRGKHLTVQLTNPILAYRLHTGGRSYGDLRVASGEDGRWLLIGDIIFTRTQLADNRAIPVDVRTSMLAFTDTAKVIVYKDSILNIGIAGPLFNGCGGEFQAEFVSGRKYVKTLTGKLWSDRAAYV